MNITVYAASSGQIAENYLSAAKELGALIAQRRHTLVNGAGRTGLMGASIDSCLQEGGVAIGVIPAFMVNQGWQHEHMSQLIITPDMHTRKEKMASLSDACIACPGGVGTLEELLEIITWKQLGLYLKPIILLNVDGFYDPLLQMFDRCVKQRFMRPQHLDIWQIATTPREALRQCEETPHWSSEVRKFAAL